MPLSIDRALEERILGEALGRAKVREMVFKDQGFTDPLLFSQKYLKISLWDKPREILQSIADGNDTLVRACHASSKTHTAAAATLWWIRHDPEAIAITTAPTWTQVEDVMWSEIRSMVNKSPVLNWPVPNRTEIRLGDKNYAMGFSTDRGARFQGFHGKILVIADEAVGIRPELFEAIEGFRAGGDVRLLYLCNPTETGNPIFNMFQDPSSRFNKIRISAFDTPNLQGFDTTKLMSSNQSTIEFNPRPYLVTRGWVRQKWIECGEDPDHPFWRARVLGEFPDATTSGFIPLSIIEASSRNGGDPGGPVHAGIDVAGPGEDETVLTLRAGTQVLAQHVFSAADPRLEVLGVLREWQPRLVAIRTDAVGIGYYFTEFLRDHFGTIVQGINVSNRPLLASRYVRLRDELWDGLKQRLVAGGITGLIDDTTRIQLSNLKYFESPDGKVSVESKSEARKRGVGSPDRAESLLLAFMTDHTPEEYNHTRSGVKKPKWFSRRSSAI